MTVDRPINVLSLFDGISCGRVALERAGFTVGCYFASEIDPAAIQISKHRFPDITHIGDVTQVSYADGVLHTAAGDFDVGEIDLVIGGSPCQSISNLGNKTGLAGSSGLFFHWLRVRDEVGPRYWLLENVQGSKAAISVITSLVGGTLHKINSNLVSAQNRNRLYWTNIPVLPLQDKGLVLDADVLERSPGEESRLTPGRLSWLLGPKGQATVAKRYASINPEKANCLTARSDASWNCNYVEAGGVYRKLSCVEYERLQTLPDGYTEVPGVPARERYKALGNGWTVDVIAHLFEGMKQGAINE